jgi:hypothetical protein
MIGLFVGHKDTKCSTKKQAIAACFLKFEDRLGIDLDWLVDSFRIVEGWLSGIRLL